MPAQPILPLAVRCASGVWFAGRSAKVKTDRHRQIDAAGSHAGGRRRERLGPLDEIQSLFVQRFVA